MTSDGPLIVAVRAEEDDSDCVALEHMYGANPGGFRAIGADRVFVRHRFSLWTIDGRCSVDQPSRNGVKIAVGSGVAVKRRLSEGV